jgi:hypothetical protein
MDHEDLLNILHKAGAFKEVHTWQFTAITEGSISPHAYRVERGKKVYFVKEVKENEANILAVLSEAKSPLIPRVIYPALLADRVLVAAFAKGKHPRTKVLPPRLIRNYALMQNALNAPEWRKRRKKREDNTHPEKDDGFYRKGLQEGFRQGGMHVDRVRAFHLPIVEKFVDVYRRIEENRDWLFSDYCTMPFARIHHDFREDNILNDKLVDWGSSYGSGPFLFDLAPFLVGHRKQLGLFMKTSDICKAHTRAKIDTWITASLVARFIDLLHWRLTPDGKYAQKKALQAFLEYEYPTYAKILERV